MRFYGAIRGEPGKAVSDDAFACLGDRAILLGLLWLLYLGLNEMTFAWTALVCMGFIVWGLSEARKTHDLLAKTRHNLLKGVDVVAAPGAALPEFCHLERPESANATAGS